MINVAVVEDDPDLCGSIERYLSLVGMTVRKAGSGAELDRLLADFSPDLIVLDVNLPGEDGFSIASRLRANRSRVGIVMLTARGQLGDRVLGLTAGADAYLVKPVQFRELEAVIHSLTRRLRDTQADDTLENREEGHVWGFDGATWSLVTPKGHQVPLTNAEYKVLQTLTADPGASVSRDEIASALGKTVGGYDDRSIDAVMARLRRKVATATGESLPIRAVRSVGYVFAAQVENRPRGEG